MESRAMIVAGFGFRAAATLQSLLEALAATGVDAPAPVVATAGDKAESPVFQALAQAHGAHVIAVSAERLEAQDTATQSDASLGARGTGSVAEAAALAAAGVGARLLVTRKISKDGMATCAIAEGPGS
jgi:cobalt-precorrin 5A hydrolase